MLNTLETPLEAERFSARINAAFREMKQPLDARSLRRDVLKTLNVLCRHRDNGTGLSRANLRHLASLVALTRAEDLTTTGGLLGGSNAWYAQRLGVEPETMTSIFRELKRAGMILPHNAVKNHRRACQRTRTGAKEGRGYTLRPLIVQLPYLTKLAEQLEIETMQRAAKQAELRDLLRVITRQINVIDSQSLKERFASISDAARAHRKTASAAAGQIDTLLREAFLLSLELEKWLADEQSASPHREKTMDQTHENSGQHHTIKKPSFVIVEGYQGVEKGKTAEKPTTSPKRKGPRSSGMKAGSAANSRAEDLMPVEELAEIFPDDAGFLPKSDTPDELTIATSVVAHSTGINSKLVARAYETIGVHTTLMAVLIVRARNRRGEIQKTAPAYFAGMIAKAQGGELNVNRSLWAERSKRSQITH